MRWMRVASIATLAMVATCGDGPVAPPPPPVSGTVTVRLTTPHADDRALIIRVTGPNMSAVVAANASLVMHMRAETNAFGAALFGNLTNGSAVLRFTIPDVSKLGQYAGTVIEVADDGNAVREALDGYALVLTVAD